MVTLKQQFVHVFPAEAYISYWFCCHDGVIYTGVLNAMFMKGIITYLLQLTLVEEQIAIIWPFVIGFRIIKILDHITNDNAPIDIPIP